MPNFSDLPNYATIKVPAQMDGEATRQIPCSFEGLRGKRLSLVSGTRLASSLAVCVEYNDALFLGEVIVCTQDCNDTWHMQIQVEQVLSGLTSLMNLRASLLGEPLPQTTGNVLTGTSR